MGEAVGLAASVIAVIDLSAKVATLCLQYSTAVGNAKADIIRLQTRLDDLGTILEGIQHLLKRRNNEVLAMSRKYADSLDGCMSELAQLQSRLDPVKAGKAMRRFGFRALKWPFHSKEVSGIVSNLERYEQNLMKCLQIDQTTILIDIRQRKEGVSLQPEGSTSLARTPCFRAPPPDRDRDPSDRPDTSVAEPERRLLKEGYWKHGRFYGSWKPGKYLFPIDSEELNRLDIFHKVFLVARGNKPFHAPVMRQTPKIMDLGAGTGIWAINMAEEYFPDAQIMAVDINQTQSTLIPTGVIPKQYDIEEPLWNPLLADCDLIYMRMLLGSIQTDLWPQIYRKVFEHLTPGLGHIEHVEIDWTPRWDDDGKPANSSFQQWAQLFLAGMDQFNRSARIIPEETRRMIAAAGFTDIRQEVIQAFVCPWSPDRREQEIARWFNVALSHSLESLSMMPLIEKQGLKFEEVRKLCMRVKRETCILRYHTYCNIYVWTARKPEWCAPAS